MSSSSDFAAFAMSSWSFWAARLSREITAQRCTFEKSPKGKLNSPFVLVALLVVDPEEPFAVVVEAVLVEVAVLFVGARSVLAPVVPFVADHLALLDEPAGVRVRGAMQFDGHDGSPFVHPVARMRSEASNDGQPAAQGG